MVQQIKEQVLQLLSDGIMMEDWQYVREAWRLIKEGGAEKPVIRIAPHEESVTSSIIDQQNFEIKPESVAPVQKFNAYGDPVPVPTDFRDKFREDADLDQRIAGTFTPSERRPPESEVEMKCVRCEKKFKDLPRNSNFRTGGNEDGNIGVLCNDCRRTDFGRSRR